MLALLRRTVAFAKRTSHPGTAFTRRPTETGVCQLALPSMASNGIDLSLDRIQALLRRLDAPQARFPVIHVAGTNAKGSTIHYLGLLLRDVVGLRTGTFTSPHLREERDCCQVDGQVIDGQLWQQASTIVEQAEAQHCTPFERLTARCFVAFDLLVGAQRPDVLLIEVGMGGSLDATNVFDDRQVLASVVGAIDLDHQAMLGDTLAEIATHKAGIVKQGGLCVLADQRRGVTVEAEPNCTKVAANPAAAQDASQIVDAVRQVCVERSARLVQAYTPWQVLRRPPSSHQPDSSAWAALTESHVRFAPTLSPSKVRQGDYVAATGDAVVPGPTLRLPATRASLMGAHLALQTLWSIARDESPCGLGIAGSDASEEMRLQIAFALRDDVIAKQAIQACVQSAQLAGRAEWVRLPIASAPSEAVMDVEEEEQVTQEGEQNEVRKQVTALLDGAHNPSAAKALRQYIDTCIASREPRPARVTITWILAFSRGKPMDQMAQALLLSGTEQDLAGGIASMSLDGDRAAVQLHHRVACVPFSTPVEGMPWVQCVPAQQALSYFTDVQEVVEVRALDGLSDALQWAAATGDGETMIEGEGTTKEANMIVIAGSLYLVSDVHRTLQA